MTEQHKGALVTMSVTAALLLGIGAWQFGGLGLGGGDEYESDDEHEYEKRHGLRGDSAPAGDISTILERVASEEDGHVIEVEREREGGRDLYEIKIAGADGRVRELKFDAETGKGIERDQ